MCSQLCSVQGGAHSCRPPFSNQAINLTSSRLETSSASTLGTFEGCSSRGPPSVTPPGMRPPLYRAGSARGPARGVCSMTVTCTHSAAPCPVSGQLDEDPNFWDGDPGVGVSPAEFHSHQLRAGVDRTEVSGSGAGPPPGGWSARGLRGSRLPPPQESREAYTRLGVGPLELQNPGGSLDKVQGRVPAEARTLGLFRRPSATPAHSQHLCWSWRFPSRYLLHLAAPSGLFFLFISTLFHKVFEAMFGKERADRWRR